MPPETRTHTKRRRTSQSMSIDEDGGHEQESLAAKAAAIVQDLVTAGHSPAAIVAAFVQAVPSAALKEAGVVVQSPQARLAAQRAQQASDYWLLCPQEIRDIIVDFAGPLTRFLHGRLDVAKMDNAARRALWVDGFQQDWQGDLNLLPDAWLEVEDVAHVSSRSMYQRLCRRSISGWIRYIPLQQMWLDAMPLKPIVDLGIMAVESNCVDFLKYLLGKNLVTIEELEQHEECADEDLQNSILNLAAERGRLEMVQYLLSLPEVSCTAGTMDLAAYSGNLDLVIWFHTNRTEGCTDDAMDWAAENGYLDVVQWLHANRTEGCTTRAIDNSALNGHLQVVQWLHANRTEGCTAAAMNNAAKNGHLDVIHWLLANRTEGFTAMAILNAKTDKIADVLVKSLTPERRNAIVREVMQTGDKAAISRILSLLA